MISLSGLNPQQRQAAETIDGPVLILAGAGSGKTRTITYRIAHMIDNLRIPGNSILGVSFTNKAAKEMKERVVTLLGKTKSRGVNLATFHSLGVRILKKEIEHLGYHANFSIYDSSDQLSLIREALKHYKSPKDAFDRKTILSKLSWLKNHGIGPDEFKDSAFFDASAPYDIATEYVYHYYQDKLHFYNAIDFDDILFLTVKLFKQHPEIAKAYSEKFRYIMIDEYQDTNTLQFQLVLALTSTHNNLCVVGDDDQAIYSFRGADITNILEFEKYFPNAKVVKLEENYRSTTPILNLANAVIKQNKHRRDKTLWTKQPSNQSPLLWLTQDTDHEAQVIVDAIVKHQSAGGHLGDIAVLYRSNTQAQPIEDELRLSQVPYTVIGGQKFYEKKEIKDLMAYMSVILNPHDQLSLRRILNVPARGIGTVTLKKYLALAEQEKINLFQALKKYPGLDPQREQSISGLVGLLEKFQQSFELNPLPQAISTLIEDLDYLSFIEKGYDNAKQVERRKNDVMRFIESAERFVKYYQANATLKNFVERLLLQDSQDRQDEGEEDHDVRKNEVTLMTLHSSKGLEFNIVYLVGVEEETLPHKRTIREGEDISEECRLCYVGVTRAKEKLVMTYCKERKLYGKNMPRNRSRFIHHLVDDIHVVEQDRTNFGGMTQEQAREFKSSFFQGLISSLGE